MLVPLYKFSRTISNIIHIMELHFKYAIKLSIKILPHDHGIITFIFFSVKSSQVKLVHEQLAFQWLGTRGELRDNALKSGWFFLELMIKAMIEHLATTDRLNANRKHRFSEQFHNDIIDLTNEITRDIVNRRGQNDTKLVENLNSSLAFFLHDLLSVMDRGFVFALIRSYSKDITAKGKMFFHFKNSKVISFQKICFKNLYLLQT